jgi:hypothetical protein
VIFYGAESPFITLCLEHFKCPATVIILKAVYSFQSKQKVTEIRDNKKYNEGMKLNIWRSSIIMSEEKQ